MTDPFSPGGFYTPIVNPSDIDYLRLMKGEIHGIELNVSKMWDFIERIRSSSEISGIEVWSDQFGAVDTAVYRSIISTFNPARIIEIGAGASTVEASQEISSMSHECEIIAIDPYPTRTEFVALGAENVKFVEAKVQDVDIDLFKQLKPKDILFIDSSHCAKTGSDVLDVMFRILPALPRGVLIHFHDIFYPFEYPFEWIAVDNRSWNEAYFLRALLTNHSTMKVILFNDYLYQDNPGRLADTFGIRNLVRPGSIWLSETEI